ncbi:MAG: hypothetical protein ACD_46C00266G0001 [uncultured bacterium]|nr:MAG: hypothetical protein ACD_46C00266G0001 [uncultured bacterium]
MIRDLVQSLLTRYGEPTQSSRLFSFHPNLVMINTVNYFQNALNGEITLEHLKRWKPNVPGAPFTQTHGDALIHLIIDQQLTADQAIDRINGKSEAELREMLPSSYHPRRNIVD